MPCGESAYHREHQPRTSRTRGSLLGPLATRRHRVFAALVETVAGSILADHGIAANGLPKVFAKVVGMGRKTAAAGTMAYAVSMRAIKTAAIEAPDNNAASVAEHLATLIGPRVRLWDADTGDRLPDGDTALKGMVDELTKYAKKAKGEETPPSMEPGE